MRAAPSPQTAPARPIRAGLRATGSLRPPPSKSVTQRYLNLALLGRVPVVLERPLYAEDTRRYLAAMSRLGFDAERRPERLALEPGPPPAAAELDCGEGGTMLRFLTAALTTLPGEWRLDGRAGLRRRPVGPLVDALRALGAGIDYLGRPGHAPLGIAGGSLRGGRAEIDAAESSQYLSAVLMAATAARQAVELRPTAITSAPYLDLTLDAMRRFGAEVEVGPGGTFAVRPSALRGGALEVEADFSSAAYPAAAAALTGGVVTLRGLRRESLQGDRGFLDLLAELGAAVSWGDEGVTIAGTGRLEAVEADLSGMPDQVPTLAALAPFCRGVTRIRNVAHLRLKESDRLAAMSRELRRLGASVEEREDGLAVAGVWAASAPPRQAVRVASHGDHRIAMSLALVGLRRPGVTVADPGVVAKSYPDFWRDLEALLG